MGGQMYIFEIPLSFRLNWRNDIEACRLAFRNVVLETYYFLYRNGFKTEVFETGEWSEQSTETVVRRCSLNTIEDDVHELYLDVLEMNSRFETPYVRFIASSVLEEECEADGLSMVMSVKRGLGVSKAPDGRLKAPDSRRRKIFLQKSQILLV